MNETQETLDRIKSIKPGENYPAFLTQRYISGEHKGVETRVDFMSFDNGMVVVTSGDGKMIDVRGGRNNAYALGLTLQDITRALDNPQVTVYVGEIKPIGYVRAKKNKVESLEQSRETVRHIEVGVNYPASIVNIIKSSGGEDIERRIDFASFDNGMVAIMSDNGNYMHVDHDGDNKDLVEIAMDVLKAKIVANKDPESPYIIGELKPVGYVPTVRDEAETLSLAE